MDLEEEIYKYFATDNKDSDYLVSLYNRSVNEDGGQKFLYAHFRYKEEVRATNNVDKKA